MVAVVVTRRSQTRTERRARGFLDGLFLCRWGSRR